MDHSRDAMNWQLVNIPSLFRTVPQADFVQGMSLVDRRGLITVSSCSGGVGTLGLSWCVFTCTGLILGGLPHNLMTPKGLAF